VASLPGRKLFQWPVAGGSTALCVDLDDPVLLDLSRGIMSATRMNWPRRAAPCASR